MVGVAGVVDGAIEPASSEFYLKISMISRILPYFQRNQTEPNSYPNTGTYRPICNNRTKELSKMDNFRSPVVFLEV